MSRQVQKNKQLLMTTIILIIAVSGLMFLGPGGSDSMGLDRAMFTVNNTMDVIRITSEYHGKTTEVAFTDGRWRIDGQIEADPSRIHLLFAAVQQAQVRRPVSSEQQKVLTDSMDKGSFILRFFSTTGEIAQIETYGDEINGLSYFRSEDGKIFLMEIPGYRAYIHGLISIESDTWRNHNLFHRMRWNTLKRISIFHPGEEQVFDIVQGTDHLEVEGIAQTDTTRLYDYIDYISLLNAERYLNPDEIPDDGQIQIRVDVRDLGERPYLLELYDQFTATGQRIGRMDSTVYFALPEESVRPLFLKAEYFRREAGN